MPISRCLGKRGGGNVCPRVLWFHCAKLTWCKWSMVNCTLTGVFLSLLTHFITSVQVVGSCNMTVMLYTVVKSHGLNWIDTQMVNYIQKEPYPTKKKTDHTVLLMIMMTMTKTTVTVTTERRWRWCCWWWWFCWWWFHICHTGLLFNPLKLNLFLDLLLDPEVDNRVPHANELQSTYHDWRTSWTDRACAVKSKDWSVDAVNEKRKTILISVWWRYLRWQSAPLWLNLLRYKCFAIV